MKYNLVGVIALFFCVCLWSLVAPVPTG